MLCRTAFALPQSLVLVIFALLAACGSDDPPDGPTGPVTETGSVTIQATTTGESGAIDRDGYTVTIGSTSRSVGPNASITITGVAVGSATVGLSGVAANCTPTATTATVTVSASAAANAAFDIDCLTLPGIARWATDIGGELSGTAVGIDGTIYAPSTGNQGVLYALMPDGSQAWTFTAGDAISGPPAVAPDGTIYFGDISGTAFALNPDGSEKWSVSLGGAFGVGSAPAIGADGTQYWSDDNFLDPPTVTALAPDGSVSWTYQNGGSSLFSGPSAAAEGSIYVGRHEGASGTFIALDPSGAEKWTFVTGGQPAAAAVQSDGTVYFGAGVSSAGLDGNLYALAPDGTQNWAFSTGGVISHAPAIGADGTIYVISGGDPNGDPDVGTLHAINPDGSEAWSATLDGCPGGGPTVGADGTIYAPIAGCRFGGSGVLEAYTASGSQLWEFEVVGEFKVILGSVPIAADGTAYVASQLTGEVYSVKTESMGLAVSAWPKAGHDNQNSGGAAGGS